MVLGLKSTVVLEYHSSNRQPNNFEHSLDVMPVVEIVQTCTPAICQIVKTRTMYYSTGVPGIFSNMWSVDPCLKGSLYVKRASADAVIGAVTSHARSNLIFHLVRG